MRTLAKVFRGLTAAFAVLVCVAVTLGIVMEIYPTPLDTVFGTLSSRIVTDDVSEEDWIYKSDFKTAKDAYEGLKDFAIEAADESMVLLKNENEALPLSKTAKITLLGLRSYAPIYGNTMGGISDIAGVNDNTIYQAFSDEGFQLNDTMYSIYQSWCNDNGGGWAVASGYAGASASFTNLTGNDEVYELSTSEISKINSNYQSSFSSYNDAAIVVVGRPGGESNEYRPGDAGYASDASADQKSTTGNILGLSAEEKEIIKLAEDNFDTVIVLINNTQQMEIEELKQDEKIDAIMWIGYPGAYGFHSVARVLNGTVSPSGHLGDTYAVNTAVNPAMMNYGDDTPWLNTSGLDDVDGNSYLIEAEGIYTGYRYYETRYADSVMGQGNANKAAAGQWVDPTTSKAGTSETTSWSYANEVSYTFGAGLSYTTFSQEIESVSINDSNLRSEAQVTVKVTNTGEVPGKDAVELYVQVPYTSYDKNNNVEKSAIQLIDYEKTEELAAGASQEITLYVDLANLASYDYTNAKTYILDYGDYYFALGDDAHDALNNIFTVQNNDNNTSYVIDDTTKTYGDVKDLVYKWTYTDANGNAEGTSVDAVTFSTSDNGTEITNQLTEGIYATDYNAFESGKVTYLSRSDWYGTYPKQYSGLSATADKTLTSALSDDFIDLATDDDTSDYTWGSTDTDYLIYDMKGADWDDERWDAIVDQVTIDEFLDFAENTFHMIYEIPSVGYAGNNSDDGPNGSDSHYLNEGYYEGVAFTDINTVNPDSQNKTYSYDSSIESQTYGEYGTKVPPAATNLAYTWNKELAYKDGQIVLGESTLMLQLPIMIGPACNLHRTAYNGRGGEYYSEDPILSGYTASGAVQGAQSKGCLVNLKHFAFNDQEINRSGIAAFMNEQKAREMELRNFQQAIEGKGKPSSFRDESSENYDSYNQKCLGIMTSYNRIGAVPSSANYAVMQTILREEWGFQGYNVTDFTGVASIAAPKESILAGTTCFCGFGASVSYWNAGYMRNDANMCAAIKTNIKYILYSLANSAAVNGTNETTHKVEYMTSWRAMYIAAEAVTGSLLGICAVGYVVTEVLASRKNKEG